MKSTFTLVLAAVLLAARSFAQPAPVAAPPAPVLSAAATPLSSPCGPDSGESSLFTAPDGTVYLTWCGPGAVAGERALRFATLAPGAAAWSVPRLIASTPLLMENWADFPTLTVDRHGIITAQWFQSAEHDGHRYSGFSARSADGGLSWSAPRPLGHEFVSMVSLHDGRVLAVWLEGVEGAHHNHAPGAPAMLLRSRLFSAAGETLRDDVVDPDVCTCCQTTLALLPGDEALVSYRGHTPAEIRDNLTARFHPDRGWTTPAVLHHDGWKIAACPVNGPALDTRGSAAALAWFTMAGGLPRVQAKSSADAGRTWGPPATIDLGRPTGRLDLVLLADHSALVSWLEPLTPKTAGWYVRRIFADGALSAPALVATTTATRTSGFARLTVQPDGRVLLAHTATSEDAPSRVQLLVIDTATLLPATRDKAAGLTATTRGELGAATVPASHP